MSKASGPPHRWARQGRVRTSTLPTTTSRPRRSHWSRAGARALQIDGVTVEALKTGTSTLGKHNIKTADPAAIASSYPDSIDPQFRAVLTEFARKLHTLVQDEIKKLIKKRAGGFDAM